MGPEYNLNCIAVNNLSCLTTHNRSYMFTRMNYSERLKKAREFAGLTQNGLIELLPKKPDGRPLMSQANLGRLEVNSNAQGSVFTVQLATACGVDPQWLATGEGSMVPRPKHEYGSNSPEAKVLKVMEHMDEGRKYMLLKIGNTLTEPEGNGDNPEKPAKKTATQ